MFYAYFFNILIDIHKFKSLRYILDKINRRDNNTVMNAAQ